MKGKTVNMSLLDGYNIDKTGIKVLEQSVPQDWKDLLEQSLVHIQNEFKSEDNEGYESLVKRLRAWTWCHRVPQVHADFASVQQIAEIANTIRSKAKAFITVGIGGSDLGGRTLHDLLSHPYHNEMVISGQIKDIPEIYFTGDTFDPANLSGLLDLLEKRGILKETYINIISKSGTTAETALAGMILADKLGDDWMSRTIATTGLNDKSLLYQMNQKSNEKFHALLPVPDGVGGRFSFPSPVGLLILAVTAPDEPTTQIERAFKGCATAHEAFLNEPVQNNPAYQLAAYLHMAEAYCGKNSLVFYPYFDNRKLGDWFVQLYEESVQERGAGLNVLSTTGPTGNHSLLNGIVNGARDKAILFLCPNDFGAQLAVPANAPLEGSLEIFKDKTLVDAQIASLKGTAQDFTDRAVPNATLTFPKRDAESAFALMRILMDMVAVKGRLQSLHIDPLSGVRKVSDEDTYIQTGVEGYKQRMRENM